MANYFVSSASGAGGAGNGSSWANAYLTLLAAIAGKVVGDVFFIGDDHNEVATGLYNINPPSFGTYNTPNHILVVDHTKASPGPNDLKVGVDGAGSISTDNSMILNFSGIVSGLFMKCAVGASTSLSISNVSNRNLIFDRCTFKNNSTGANTRIFVAGSNSHLEFRNCLFVSSGANQNMFSAPGLNKYINCTIDCTAGIAAPIFFSGTSQRIVLEAMDLSNIPSGKMIFDLTSNGGNTITVKDCKLPSWGIPFTLLNNPRPNYDRLSVINCDNGSKNYQNYNYDVVGTQSVSVRVFRTGGASQGIPYSWLVTTSATDTWYEAFQLTPLSIWNQTSGAAVNVTVEGIADTRDFFQLPNNDEVWFDVEALESAASPIGTYHYGTKANLLAAGSALSASTAAWDCANTRANSTAYNLGDIIKVASNPGRLFMCTGLTTGITASSEPGGYATAVDGGGGVTDGGCVFKAMWRFKQTITTGTIGMAGLITVYPKVAKASLNGIYIDPMITLS